MATKPMPAPLPSDPVEASFTRTTKDGRTLRYLLKVLQQPSQARACGAGAKSSADRRPVDPPPVVQLNVFQVDADGKEEDITIHYNAGFFLYTTLEWARPMAHGRVQGQPICPVLTGVAVAGVAYLDRPNPAGYFIFPDLSVRHEGLYRLSFNLYEEVKNPEDEDKNAPEPPRLPMPTPRKLRGPQKFLHFRLHVRSNEFTVFSAKKFPGLSESTELSRCVAEQGCRVRIRRDVRLRRRETKPGEKYSYGSRHPTPATPIERPRSTSNASMDHPHGYAPTPQHPSVRDMGYPSQAYPHVSPMQPMIPGQGSAPMHHSHLEFGVQSQHYAPLPPQPRAPFQSPLPGYSHTRQMSGEYPPSQIPPYPASRPPTAETKPVLPPMDYPQPAYHDRRSSDLAYPKPIMSPSPAFKEPSTPASRVPPIPPRYDLSGQYGSSYGPARPEGPSQYPLPPSQPTKRSHREVFPSHDSPAPLRNGQRPDEVDDKLRLADISDDGGVMKYARADGRVGVRTRN